MHKMYLTPIRALSGIALVYSLLVIARTTSADGLSESVAGQSGTPSVESWLAKRERLVPEHELTSGGGLVAIDLLHGVGGKQLCVERTWSGADSGAGQFGSGWHDSNIIRLRREADDLAVVTRGPIVWISATRSGDREFTSAAGHVLRVGSRESVLSHDNGLELRFRSDGNLTRFRSAEGTSADYSYTRNGLLSEVRLGSHNALKYHYENGRVTRVEGPEGASVEYVYDAGRLREVVNGWRHRIQYLYESDGSLVAALDQYGDVTAVPPLLATASGGADGEPLKPDEYAQLVATAELYEQGEANAAQTAALAAQFDELGRTERNTTSAYSVAIPDEDNAQLLVAIAAAGADKLKNDEFGRIIEIERPDGQQLTVIYDQFNVPSRIDWSGGTWKEFHRNAHSNLIRTVSANGNGTTYAYDERGRIASIRPVVGVGREFSYDDNDRVTTIRFSDEREVEFTYDAVGQHIQTAWSHGGLIEYSYGPNGRLISKNANGLTTSFRYDDQGVLIAVADPIHGSREYDRTGSTEGELRVLWGPGLWTYRGVSGDDLYETAVAAEGLERRTLVVPNRQGKASEVVTSSGRVWSYLYDEAGRLTRIELPGGQAIELGRDRAGRLTKLTRDGLDYRNYMYDNHGRLQMETSPAGIAAVYSRDELGRLDAIIAPDGQVDYNYDDRGLVTSFSSPDYVVGQEYHADGSLARRNDETAGLDIRLLHDELGRPAGISLNGIEVGYEYGDFSRVQALILPNDVRIWILRDQAGRPTEISLGENARIGLTWDYCDRLTSVGATSGADNLLLFLEQYEYDVVGNLTQLFSLDLPPREMSYDADDRLAAVTSDAATKTFSYDDNDNLTSVTSADDESLWLLDGGGRPISLGTRSSYQWDKSGSLIAIHDVSLEVRNTFDYAGRLVNRTVGDASWSFGYSPDGDRLWQEGPQGRTWYAYLPDGLTAIKDEAGTPWLVVYLPGTDRPLALCGPDGATLFLVTDHLNSIRQVLDPAGQVLAFTNYGAYGQILDNVGTAPLAMYAGMIRDNHGLYYARNRYYDPALLRFISMDEQVGSHELPVSHNPYAYAGDNPFRFRHAAELKAQVNIPDADRVERFE